MIFRPLSVAFLQAVVLTLCSAIAHAQPTAAPYNITVWSVVLFDDTGSAKEVDVVNAADYPKAFLANVKARLAKARIPAVADDQGNASFKTGVRMDFNVKPNNEGGDVTMIGLSVLPLPIKSYYASYPEDVRRSGGWKGSVSGECDVGLDGKCTHIQVKALPGMPESVRRFMRASLEGWEFKPQEVRGKPVVGAFNLRVNLETEDSQPQDFRESKFDRIQATR